MVKAHYYIGVTNRKIAIYDSTTEKLLPPIPIRAVQYKHVTHSNKTLLKKKLITMEELMFWRQKVLKYRFLKKHKHNLAEKFKPKRFFAEEIQKLSAEPCGQRNVCRYARQVFKEILVRQKIKKQEISSICFVLDECDNYKIRAWISRHAKKHKISKVHLVNWRTAALMEILAKTKYSANNGDKVAVLYVFDEFYHLYLLHKLHNRWHVKGFQVFLNDFSKEGFSELNSELKKNYFDPNGFIIYLYGETVRNQNTDVFFIKGLSPKNVKILRKRHSDDMDLVNGAVLKSRTYSRDQKANKYDVHETCYMHLRANLDNKTFIRLNTFLREYPFTISTGSSSRGLYYLWLEYNYHGLDANWKLQQIYPHSFVRDRIDFKVEFDQNGVSSINVHNPPQAAFEDKRSFIFARFRVRRKKRVLPPLPPPPRFKASGKRIIRTSRTPKNYRQRRVYQQRKKSTPPPPKKHDPNKIKRIIEDPLLKKQLRKTAERMDKWQTRKFLME
ncbi:hypothetical protein FO519_004139 [Halicephalobus sp. NKZ332]|nr:hypothetical protein FO519_004139 [Halicephalobus sp. NKZ332]